jgi:hypothetical protein
VEEGLEVVLDVVLLGGEGGDEGGREEGSCWAGELVLPFPLKPVFVLEFDEYGLVEL